MPLQVLKLYSDVIIGDLYVGALSGYARRKRIERLLSYVPDASSVLEVGCGEGWVADYLKSRSRIEYHGLDLNAPADFVGDIRDWRQLGLEAAYYDVIVAFEVIEHVECTDELYELLKPGGILLLTTPVPHWDWACWILERLGINQRRGTRHKNLTYVSKIPRFQPVELFRFNVVAQWARLVKPE